jgi:hypothetical protein
VVVLLLLQQVGGVQLLQQAVLPLVELVLMVPLPQLVVLHVLGDLELVQTCEGQAAAATHG